MKFSICTAIYCETGDRRSTTRRGLMFWRRRRRNELHCHECDKYVQFILDQSLNGNHVLNCPNCGHEHCRVVKDGLVTDDRWGSRNGPTYQVATSYTAFTSSSIYTASSTAYFAMMTDTYGAGTT